MLIKEMLIKELPVLKISDTGSYALSLMEDYKLKHLPVTDNGIYVFLLSEKNIFSMENIHDPIDNLCMFAPCVGEESHILEVLRIFSNDKLTLLPVVDSKGNYIGGITSDRLIEKLDEIINSTSKGSIIALEISQFDYDLSNIARITESNNAKILTLFTYPVKETNKQLILIKIDLEDASPVLRSLERFNYQVIYYFQKEGLVDDVLRRRLDELMYYLKM